MKKLWLLLPVLFTLTTTACVSKPVQKEIILPPKPERQEQKEPTNLKEIAALLNYYEHLVQQWETWGDITERMVQISNEGMVEP
jgi:hypothetical protein